MTFAVADGVTFGPDHFVLIAGPCAVEDREQLQRIAAAVEGGGADLLRGGAFKPRTRRDSFQGLGAPGLALLREASRTTGLGVVTEVMDPRDVEAVAEVAAVLQIGSRSMQNFPLLREAGRSGLPVLLKRGAAASLDEFVAAADYILAEGNPRVVLCERGIVGFDRSTRYLLDLAAVPLLQARTGLPVVVDPSHATGRRDLVASMARAATAAGADGIMVEVHDAPDQALCDGPQALLPAEFSELAVELRALGRMMGRSTADAVAGNVMNSTRAT